MPNLKQDESIEESIARERIRQARRSFDLALFMTAAFACIGLAGVGLLLIDKNAKGIIPATGGTAISARYLQMARDANDRLDKLSKARRRE